MIQASQIIPFGEWLPDLGAFNNPGALTVKNCIPIENGRYSPFNDLVDYSDALANNCKGAFTHIDSSGTVRIFAGSKTKLYKLSGTAWEDVTRTTGGDYATTDDGFWNFVAFGDLVIATNYTDDIQVFDTATDTDFSQLSSTAPRCRTMFVLKNFLVCLDVVDGDGSTSYRARWSPLGDPEGDWTDIDLQADFQDIIGGSSANYVGFSIQDVGYITQNQNIIRMEYIAGTAIFRFENVEDAKGSKFYRGAVTNGRDIFYRGVDGFYQFNGVYSAPIGSGKVDNYFNESFNASYPYNVLAAIDPYNKLVVFAYPSKTSSGGTPDTMLIYNWSVQKWAVIEQDIQLLFNYVSSTYTLEGLDAISTSLDALPFSLDSQNWKGGTPIFGAFDNVNRLGSFEGSPKEATLGSGEIRFNENGKSTIHSVIPYIEGSSTLTARLGMRDNLSDSITWTDIIGKNSITGEFDFCRTSRYSCLELLISGDWKKSIGFAYRADKAGDV